MRELLPHDATAADPISAIDANAAPSAARQVLRVVVGSTLLAIEGAGSALQHVASELPSAPAPTGPLPPASARHVVIGALAVGPAWVNQQMQRLTRRGRGALAGGVQRASIPLRFAARLLPTDEIRRWLNELRTRAIATALSLAEVGRREEPIARSLARAAVTTGLASAIDLVASSPQVRSLIREQSAGMGRMALNDLRAQSARADTLAESVVRHLLPRGRRKKSGESEPR